MKGTCPPGVMLEVRTSQGTWLGWAGGRVRLAETGWLLPSAPGRCGVCTALGLQLAPSCPCEGTQMPGALVPTLSSRKRARLRGGRLSAGAVGAQRAWTVSAPERRRAEQRQSRPKEGRWAAGRRWPARAQRWTDVGPALRSGDRAAPVLGKTVSP